MISFAGVPLLAQADACRDVLLCDPSWIVEGMLGPFPGANLTGLGATLCDHPGPNKPGTLLWPCWGASRFALGWFLANDAQLALIRPQAYAGNTNVALPLVVADGRQSITLSQMFLLPPRPLAQPGGGTGGLWLLPIVDGRFWWWYSASSISVTAGTTTWATLFASLASALGIALTVPTIATAYLKPSGTLGRAYEALPLLLDAAADSCGLRLVANYDGTFALVDPVTSKATLDSNHAAFVHLAGGEMSLLGSSAAVGPASLGDLDGALPASVCVVFPRGDGHAPPYAITETLAGLALPELTGVGPNGFTGTKVLHDTAVATLANVGDATPSNLSALQALAVQVATDWYRHRLGRADVRLSGACPWAPEGLTDWLEWSPTGNGMSTRAWRGPLLDRREELFHFTAAGPGLPGSQYQPPPGTTISYQNDTLIIDGDTFLFQGGNDTWTFSPSVQLNIGGPSSAQINFNGPTVNFAGPVNFNTGPIVFNDVFDLCSWWLWCFEFIVPVDEVVPAQPFGKAVQKHDWPAGAFPAPRLPGFPVLPAPGPGGVIERLINRSSNPGYFTNEDTHATATQRIRTPGGLTLPTAPDDVTDLYYDDGINRWRVTSTTADVYRPEQPVTIAANTNNQTINANTRVLRVNCTGAANLTGLLGGIDGRMVTITNVGSATLTITNQDAGSTGSNQFLTSTGGALPISAKSSRGVVYDATSSAWRDVDVAGADAAAATIATATNVLSGTYTMVAFADTGVQLALAASSTYLIACDVRWAYTLTGATNVDLQCRLHDGTSTIASSERQLIKAGTGVSGVLFSQTSPLTWIVTTTGAITLRLQAAKIDSSVYTVGPELISDGNGRTTMTAVKTG